VPQSRPQKQEPPPSWRLGSQVHAAARGGSLDGFGAASHDQPYRFGWRPRSSVPYPFNTRKYSRLLVLRSRVQHGLLGADGVAA
jgi:hypothetical protein